MKPARISCASLGLFLAIRASAQDVVSQLGGYSEQVHAVPAQVEAGQPSALSLFLQQDAPLAQPQFPVASGPLLGLPPLHLNVASPAAAPPPVAVAPVVPPPVAPSPPQGFLRPKGMLTLRSMRVANTGTEGSKVFFGANSEFAMGTDAAGNFKMEKASDAVPLVSLDSSNTLHLGSARVEALALDALSGLSVRGVKQWQLVHSEDFSVPVAGWSRDEVTQCAGVFMLGGFCKFSRGEVNKTFTGLPPHMQLRVVATYHFIDRWIGETAYMKLDIGKIACPVVVWSERHAQQEVKNGLDLCGDAGTPEGKFAAPVDVTVSHHQDAVTVTFGSTMDDADACDESWGISNLEVYIRD